MAGTIVYIDGAVPASTSGAKINVSASDKAASKIYGMTSAFTDKSVNSLASPSTIKDSFSGGAAEATGDITVATSSAFNGKRVAGFDATKEAIMPTGSFPSESFTYVCVFSFDSDHLTSENGVTLSRYNSAGTRVADLIRIFPGGAFPGVYIQAFNTGASQNNGGLVPMADVSADTAYIAVGDYNAETGLFYATWDGVEVANKTLSGSVVAEETDSLAVGFNGIGGLDGSIARVYAFDHSVYSSEYGATLIDDLVAALKSDYGIA